MITVLSIAFPFAPVGPNLVGGAEQILSDLDQALTARGDQSLVVACEGSQPSGKLFSIPAPRWDALDDPDRTWCRTHFHAALNKALACGDVDLIHAHCMDLYDYEFPPDIPLVVTLHLPISWYSRDTVRRYVQQARFVYVSDSQRRTSLRDLGDAPVIGNGVDVAPALPDAAKSDFALVMGRICPEKNAHAALEAGTRARTKVVIAGQVFPYRSHQQYFEEKIEPLIENSKPPAVHQFVGPLTPKRRQQFLSQAKCLLHPTLAPETSSLVAMEALAAGTPVIAYKSGALPEIVEDGATGFLVEDPKGMADAIQKIKNISPEACHHAARTRFSKQRMVDQYFDLYHTILREGPSQCIQRLNFVS